MKFLTYIVLLILLFFESVKEVYLIVGEKTGKYYLIDRKGLKKVQ